jgi:hypothetical protein
MSLLRLPFILSEIVFLQAATVRPNPSPEEHEKVPPKGLETIFAKIVPWYAAVLNVCRLHLVQSYVS